MGEQSLDLAVERRAVGKIHQADRPAADFVLISRADPAPRRADRERGAGIFAYGIELAVQRQDQRRIFGDAQIVRRDVDALLFQLGDFFDERVRVEHDAVADDRQLSRTHHARRQERELVGGAVDHQRVAGIVAALEADHDVGLLRQPINNLALALVAPLGADHDNIGHQQMSPKNGRRRRMNDPRTFVGRDHRPRPFG